MYNNSTIFIACNGTESNNYLRFSMSASMSIDILSQKTLKWQVALKVIYISLSTLQFLTATICNLLTMKTLLKKKIRITSLGVYLIVFILASLIGMILLYVRIIVTLVFNEELDKNSLIHCRIITTILNSTLILSLWTGAFVSIERVLIQLYNYSLYRSRKYAVIISVLLILLTAAANITTFIGWQSAAHPIVTNMRLCKFRQFPAHWKLVDEIVNSMYIHTVIPWILHVLSIVFVLIDIIRHQIILTGAKRCDWRKIICQQLKKHKDFFLSPILILTCTLPHVLLINLFGSSTSHVCSKSNMNAYLRLHIAFDFLYYSLQTIGFFTYIYPSNVYMNQFRKTWIVRTSRAVIAALFGHHKSRTSDT
ncbi:unnamed protein product [Rotaria sp. Silwood2]|nr:unnamed protein product [Rotaria sp. Silwood2]CAF2883362.1 unnamed protein product [Rotaria sp. Silwood2]CAF3408387.1 unnamed protein product [Rotaria sp. Silwood2]CAF4367876.1 unnamed protein product [Rotaria sp. Silwood2]CAF4509972.1 unnamed protein product [Rotaria sp. Silwood2]